SAEAGTRYVFISHAGWDFHASIYEKTKKSNHYTICHELDAAFAGLLTDLARMKTKRGEPLLDKTLIVCMGEFGRTVGDLTVNKGRDHHRFASTSIFDRRRCQRRANHRRDRSHWRQSNRSRMEQKALD